MMIERTDNGDGEAMPAEIARLARGRLSVGTLIDRLAEAQPTVVALLAHVARCGDA